MKNFQKELENYNNKGDIPMHMPGHKRNLELLENKLPYNIDITEIDGFDDLHHAKRTNKRNSRKSRKNFWKQKEFYFSKWKYLWNTCRNKKCRKK